MNRGRILVAAAIALLATAALGQVPAPKSPPAGTGPKPSLKPAPAEPDAHGTPVAVKKKVKQVFVLPLKGMVGAGLRHEEMEAVEKEADKFGPGQVIVLRINSGGGDVTEGDRIVRTLSRIRDKHRVVAWIEEAISGAAFTAFNCREIYFFTVGTMGSITKFYSDSSGQHSATGKDREAWSDRVAEVAELGGHSPIVARAMVWADAVVSYTKDPKTGKVTFFADKSGDVLLSDEKDNLTFNASNALDCGFIGGVADTESQLVAAMQLAPGTFEINEAGKSIGERWNRTLEKCKKERAAIEQDLEALSKSDLPVATQILKTIDLWKRVQDLWKKAPPVAEGMEGGGPLLPAEIEKLVPDMEKKYRGAADGAGKAKVVNAGIDRYIEELRKKLAKVGDSGG